ncbi:MAG: hypothetical protein VX733_03415 [Candidatus Latescibacterota bacterium]|nr:hypothetical protein [Candidatus Latescibacterota bacterium]
MKRVVSHWAHVQAEPGAWLPPEQFDVAGRSLLDLLESQPLALFDNNQVRYLSGAAEYDGMTLTSRMEKGDLQKALDAVHGGLLAAPVDDFDAALLWWAHELDWSAPYYRRINVRKKGAAYLQLTASELSALESWNRLDASLVEEVGVVFREKIVELEKKTGLPIDQQREAFRRRNESPAVQARLLMHTASRGLKHPIRALRSVKRQVTSR